MTYWKNLKYSKHDTSATVVVRKFHNFIKLQVFKEFAQPVPYRVLELAAGRGVDIHKHRQLGADYVLYVDTDLAALQSFQQTWTDSSTCKVDFCQVDLLQPVGLAEIQRTMPGLVDLVSLQFALHYFLENTNSLELIIRYLDQFLRVGGHVIFSSVDGEQLHTRLNRGVCHVTNAYRQPIASYYRNYDSKCETLELGKSVDVRVSSIGQTHSEFLVDYKFLLGHLQSKGFQVVQDKNFTAFQHDFTAVYPNFRLSTSDIKFSSLHRITVLRKLGPVSNFL